MLETRDNRAPGRPEACTRAHHISKTRGYGKEFEENVVGEKAAKRHLDDVRGG